MRNRTFAILAVLFVALLIVALLQSLPPSEPTTIPVSTALADFTIMGRELDMRVLDINAIRLSDPRSERTFTLQRDASGNWTAPGSSGTLDSGVASTIARTVVLLPFRSTVELKEDGALDQYGFQSPGTLSIGILLNNGSNHAILISGLAPSQLAYYALVDQLPRIYLLERGAVDFLMTILANPPLT